MKDPRLFFVYWIANSVLIYFAPYLSSPLIVVGNARLSAFLASIISGFLLVLGILLMQPVFKTMGIKLNNKWQMYFSYLFINVVGVWVVARYADLTGFGIRNAWIAVVFGSVITLVQWLVEQFMSHRVK